MLLSQCFLQNLHVVEHSKCNYLARNRFLLNNYAHSYLNVKCRLRIRDESLQHYDLDWARLERYLHELKDHNPTTMVDIQKDTADNSLLRYFVGIGPAKYSFKHVGLGFWGVDSCHTRHFVVQGMQLHILVGRTGSNSNMILAFSLDISETNDSYIYFADCCHRFGFGDVLSSINIKTEKFKTTQVCFSDGFKGTQRYVSV